jgi:predicted 2-oxoglutarate/Fe(II)-dependent dioxygenase YbiX
MKNLIDYINVYRNEIDPTLCDRIVETISKSEHWVDAKVGPGKTRKDYRNCNDLNLAIWPDLDSSIYQIVNKVMGYYRENHPYVDISHDSGYNVLRYGVGSFYKEHVDSFTEKPRSVSCSMVLNDGFEGGDFSFFGGNQTYVLGKGDILMFPSNFMYPHQITPVTNGVRYSIVTWMN